MVKISDLSDELLVKIISFLPTKKAVSTSILSKQWEFLWMWLPKLKFYFSGRPESRACLRDFIDKNLPLHKAPIIESLGFRSYFGSVQPEDLKPLVGIAVSRCVRKLSIYLDPDMKRALSLPGSLYTSNSLVTLKLDGKMILVDIPPTVCLPSLKTLRLECVTYSNDDSLRLFLSCCPVLEDLFIDRKYYDNLRAVVIDVPSLQRLTLFIDDGCSTDGYVMVTPSLKYFQVVDDRVESSCLIGHMPELEEADIWVMEDNEKDIGMLLKSITTVKRLSIRIRFNISGKETVYSNDIVFGRLENLKLCICSENWSMLLVQLLQDSPNLKILNLFADYGNSNDDEYEPVSWSNNEGPIPKCLLDSLETFKFKGYDGREPEDRDFLSFIFKHARCLKSTIILQRGCYVPVSP